MARAAPSASGCTMSVASDDIPAPANSARIVAPRRWACSSVSSTKMPAPSPSTSPRRCFENGRQVSSAITRMASHALTTPRVIQASLPPASATSASPARNNMQAWASAWLDEAQALETANAGPRRPNSRQICDVEALNIDRTMLNGCTRGWPSPYKRRDDSSCVDSPPAPVPTTTAVRSASAWLLKSSPACATASRAATRAYWATGSSSGRRFSLKYAAGSKPLTSAAMGMRAFAAGTRVIGVMPGRPSRMAAQVAVLDSPRALTQP